MRFFHLLRTESDLHLYGAAAARTSDTCICRWIIPHHWTNPDDGHCWILEYSFEFFFLIIGIFIHLFTGVFTFDVDRCQRFSILLLFFCTITKNLHWIDYIYNISLFGLIIALLFQLIIFIYTFLYIFAQSLVFIQRRFLAISLQREKN